MAPFLREIGKAVALSLSLAVLPSAGPATAAQFKQLGPRLVGTGDVGYAFQGVSVALSADGSTAVMGGSSDNSGAGAAWVFHSGRGTWAQQGHKLVGSGGASPTQQGFSVALSADGNTAALGGRRDAWVFTRKGGTWTQQGEKLEGTGAVGDVLAYEGVSVALSAEGNTLLIGADGDNGGVGTAWVFVRTGGTWAQQGSKLVGTGGSAYAGQGRSVALSADGTTALIGGYGDRSDAGGAAWVFTREKGGWSQEGAKLVGTGNVGKALQGVSVALSADGNTALIGGFGDNSLTGAAWVFTRSGGAWTQQGAKLVGTGAAGPAAQGFSVALSADGNTALIGATGDASTLPGAAWLFTRENGVWTQQGSKLVGTGAVVGAAKQGISVALSGSGRIAIVGGWTDSAPGGAWVFAAPDDSANGGKGARHPAIGK